MSTITLGPLAPRGHVVTTTEFKPFTPHGTNSGKTRRRSQYQGRIKANILNTIRAGQCAHWQAHVDRLAALLDAAGGYADVKLQKAYGAALKKLNRLQRGTVRVVPDTHYVKTYDIGLSPADKKKVADIEAAIAEAVKDNKPKRARKLREKLAAFLDAAACCASAPPAPSGKRVSVAAPKADFVGGDELDAVIDALTKADARSYRQDAKKLPEDLEVAAGLLKNTVNTARGIKLIALGAGIETPCLYTCAEMAIAAVLPHVSVEHRWLMPSASKVCERAFGSSAGFDLVGEQSDEMWDLMPHLDRLSDDSVDSDDSALDPPY